MISSAGNFAISHDYRSVWDALLLRLRNDLGEITYRNWIRHLVLRDYDFGKLTLCAPTRFIKEWIETNYGNVIAEVVREAFPELASLVFEVDKEAVSAVQKLESDTSHQNVAENSVAGAPIMDSKEKNHCDIWGFPLDARFSFESFVVGESNKAAYAMSKMVAENRMCGNANIVYIHSSVGQGKTHLLQSVASYTKNSDDGRSVLYLSAEKFLHLFIKYTRANDLIGFKEKIKSADLLLVDDLQFICGKVATQQEFSNILSALSEAGKTVILTSDSNPFALNLDARSKSRITAGFVVEVCPPEPDLRAAILRKKAERAKVPLSDDIIELIASSISSSVRELEGALNQIIAHYNFEGQISSLTAARQLLRNNLDAVQKKVSLSDILQLVADQYGVEVAALKSKSRAIKLILPRQIFAALAKEHTTHSMQEIGKFLGGRDHTSVVYYLKQIAASTAKDQTVLMSMKALSDKLYS